jgi:uncharacterized Fe-S cluster-containing radical SAM superfamily enzyme
MLERKTVEIYAYDVIEPTICLTYIVQLDTNKGVVFAQDLQCWVRQSCLDDFRVLYVAYKIMRNINKHKNLREKHIFIEYQKLSKKELWTNYKTKTEWFNTEKIAHIRKPYREFELVTTEFLDKRIGENIIKVEGEIK